jgi:hypothetical protein
MKFQHTHERMCNNTEITRKYLEKFKFQVESNLMKSHLWQSIRLRIMALKFILNKVIFFRTLLGSLIIKEMT